MSKYLFLFCFITGFSLLADTVRVSGFEPEDKALVKESMNCQIEKMKAAQDEIIPDGKSSLKVTLGGLNEKKGGGVVIAIPTVSDDAQTISIWIKGNPENKFGPVIMFGDWCWMGKRYEPKAQITVSEAEWIKYEFNLKDFVPALNRTPKGPKQFNKYKYLYIILGESKEYPESIEFFIDKIEIK